MNTPSNDLRKPDIGRMLLAVFAAEVAGFLLCAAWNILALIAAFLVCPLVSARCIAKARQALRTTRDAPIRRCMIWLALFFHGVVFCVVIAIGCFYLVYGFLYSISPLKD